MHNFYQLLTQTIGKKHTILEFIYIDFGIKLRKLKKILVFLSQFNSFQSLTVSSRSSHFSTVTFLSRSSFPEPLSSFLF